MKSEIICFEDTQPYKLGLIYRQMADLLMNPKTDIRDLVEFSRKHGFKLNIEILPNEDDEETT